MGVVLLDAVVAHRVPPIFPISPIFPRLGADLGDLGCGDTGGVMVDHVQSMNQNRLFHTLLGASVGKAPDFCLKGRVPSQ